MNTPVVSTRLASTIDFAANGLQHGFLKLPHSTHDSAYGWIPIPIAMVANGKGPTVLVMAGNHGDEYEGQIAAMKVLRLIDPAEIRGRVIFLTAANFPAVMAGRRVSPIDGGNLNRSFPGEPNGTVTQMIAHYIESVLLPMSDYVLDFHSGGSSLDYVAHVHARRHADPAILARTIGVMEAFGASYGGLVKPLQGEPRTMSAAAERAGVTYVNIELGGGGTVTRRLVELAERGIWRVLNHLAMVPAERAIAATTAMRRFSVSGVGNFVYAMDDGLFEPAVDLLDEVEPGRQAGAMHFPETPWRDATVVTFPTEGLVICRRFPGWAKRGDCLYQIAGAPEVDAP
jgi:predicted deacylase